MLKKYGYFSVIFMTLFLCTYSSINAYEFIDQSNEGVVNDLINQIYDAKEQYEFLAGEESPNKIDLFGATSVYYWWPIGSEEITEVDGKKFAKGEPMASVITSNYGWRENPTGEGMQKHSGIDISGAFANGQVSIIAVKSGIVVDVGTGCYSEAQPTMCNQGSGNYVTVQHSDGNYSLYAHLYEDSITVTQGEAVDQGQVIGKMGSSGNSTGTHLHFEIREGQNNSSATVDPLNYISLETPRLVFTGSELLTWLNSWEGHSPIEGDYYIVENIGDGVRTVGGGITLENNPQKFEQYGIDIDDYPVGSKIPIAIVDQIQYEVINAKRSSIEGVLSKNSITLQENEIQALVSHMYNTGNIKGFADAYKQYGNTQSLYDNWFFRNVMKGTKFEKGLTRRRNAEWSLFHEGIYVYNR